MRAHFVKACALLSALALARAAVVQDDSGEAADSSSPKNLATANENRKDENTSPVGKVAQSKKGEVGDVVNFLNDGPANNDVKDMLVTLCEEHKCTTLKLGEVEPHLVKSAAAFTPTLKGNTALSENALAPALQMSERALSALESQKSLIDQLEKETQALEALSQSLSKGSSQLNFETQPSANQKGNSFLQAFASSKGNSNNFFDAMLGPSKGSGNLLQMEASLCPMLKIQLATAQSQLADTKNRLDSVTALLTAVNAHKSQLENALKVSESIREALKNQALESAKEAAEEKGKNSLLTVELEKTVSEKKALSEQKAELEGQLATTQSELLAEKQESAALSDALKKETKEKQQCTNDLFATQTELRSTQNQLKVTNNMLRQSQDQLAAKTQDLIQERAEHQATEEKLTATQQELQQTQENLREKERELGEAQVAYAKLQRQLDETQAELAATEDARKKLEEKKQELEEDLASTNSNLQQVSAERDQLQVQLNETTTELSNRTALLEQCETNYAQEKSEKEALSQQLSLTATQLIMEKKAREEQAYVVAKVREATLKVHDEVQKLQLENLQLQQEAQKLKNEQRVALALASGCPQGYVRKDSSCYKLIPEDKVWKSAQDRCVQDGANLVSIDSRDEQVFIVEYIQSQSTLLSDNQVFVGGVKIGNSWKWVSSGLDVGLIGPSFFANDFSVAKPGYDCLAVNLADPAHFGKWVGQQCLASKPAICEYSLSPLAFAAGRGKGGASARDTLALLAALKSMPSYLEAPSKGNTLALLNRESKGNLFG